MKNSFLTMFICFVGYASFAQWNPNGATTGNIYYSNGNVGIGTSNPGAKLSLRTSTATQGLIISNCDAVGHQTHFGLTTADQSLLGVSLESYFNIYNDGKWSFNSSNTNGGTTFPLSFNTDGVSRFYIAPNGNVGVGITNPNFKLEIPANTQLAVGYTYVDNPIEQANNYVRSNFGSNVYWDAVNDVWVVRAIGANDFSAMIHPNGGGFAFMTAPDGGNVGRSFTNSQFASFERMRISADGNVGIGTSSPDKTLTIDGEIGFYRNGVAPTNSSVGYIKYDGGFIMGNISGADPIRFQTNSTDRLYIDNGGNIGIGTTDPGNFKLAVEGKIGAREVNVLTGPGWPDYVFGNDYKLPSLSEVAIYIKENRHLPEIPSEKEVKENGVDLGEMNKLLLKKVEELTVYMIEQSKIIKEQDNRIKMLEEKSSKK